MKNILLRRTGMKHIGRKILMYLVGILMISNVSIAHAQFGPIWHSEIIPSWPALEFAIYSKSTISIYLSFKDGSVDRSETLKLESLNDKLYQLNTKTLTKLGESTSGEVKFEVWARLSAAYSAYTAIYVFIDNPYETKTKYPNLTLHREILYSGSLTWNEDDMSFSVSKSNAWSFGDTESWSSSPILDFSASTDSIGREMMVLQYKDTSNKMSHYRFEDKYGQVFSADFNGGMMGTAYLPFTEDSLTVTKVPLITEDGSTDISLPVSATCNYGLTRTKIANPYKSLVGISGLSVQKNFATDSEGLNTSSYDIMWKVTDNPANDVVSSDQFIVYRSHYADFSDPVAIGNVSLTGYDDSLTKSKNDGGYWYKVTDNDEEAQYNSSQYGQKVYYKVARALISTKWSDHEGIYVVKDSVTTTNRLPNVTQVKLSKKDNFELNKTVLLDIQLAKVSGQDSIGVDSKQFFAYRNTVNTDKYIALGSDNVLELVSDPAKEIALKKHYDSNGNFYLTYNGTAITLVGHYLKVGGSHKTMFSFSGNMWYYANAASSSHKIGTKDGKLYMYEDGTWRVLKEWEQTVVKESNQTLYADYVRDANMQLRIDRYSPEDEWWEGKDYASKTFYVRADDIKYDTTSKKYYANVEDVQNAPYTHYYYKVSVDNTDSYYISLDNTERQTTKAEADMCWSESIAQIDTVIATKGTALGMTHVKWNSGNGENDGYILERRQYKETYAADNDEWTKVELANAKATEYSDDLAYPSLVYEYRVKGYLDVRGKRYWTDPKTAYGFTKYYGHVQGKISMDDGSAWPLKVSARMMVGNTGVYINKVVDRDTKETIINAVNIKPNKIFTVDTKDDGTFEFDSIPYVATELLNTAYELSMDADNVTNPSGSVGPYQISFTTKRYEYTNLKFTSSKTRTCSGRIIFAGSTIPSRGIRFEITDPQGNARTLMGEHGEPVVTDNNGDYKFSVPYTPGLKVRAYKDGHTLQYNGKLQGDVGQKDVVCDVEDSTTVRLVGRLVGGNIQGDKPLGYGLSTNNLADSLTVVLQLEGDNTSYITYNDQDPDNTQRDAVFYQNYNYNGIPKKCDTTYVSFERKRIVLHPNKVSGEFCLDLPPTKYKITQMYGTGYATFFSEGEGSVILDLTNDSTMQKYSNLYEGAYYDTEYHHSYNRIYHTPTLVTYQQCDAGGAILDFLGDEESNVTTIYGTKINAKYYENGKYLFGYPVFSRQGEYNIKVSAHEDYYYNNDMNTLPDEIGIKEGKLHVTNGFVSDDNTRTLDLDSTGCVTFALRPDNVKLDNASFNLTGEEALRQVNMQVEQNGYYYEAEPLKGFITGQRESSTGSEGTDILPLLSVESSDIQLVDIIRDPYTSGGYAYRERGSTYLWNREQSFDIGVDFDLSLSFGSQASVNYGAWVGVMSGGYTGTTTGGSSTVSVSTTIPGVHYSASWSGNYELTLNERIATSSDPKDVGAMADVYVGVIPTVSLYHSEAFNVVDDDTYKKLKNSVTDGRVKLVASGNNANGDVYHLIIADQLSLGQSKSRTFAYSQKHILYNVIPELLQKFDELVVYGTKEEVQALADKNNTTYYRIIKDDYNAFTSTNWYETIFPTGSQKIESDEVKRIITTLKSWCGIIKNNEERKLGAMSSGKLLKSYSISDVSVDYTQDASYKYSVIPCSFTILGTEVRTGGMFKGIQIGVNTKKFGKDFGETTPTKTEKYTATDGDKTEESEFTFETPGAKFSFEFTPQISLGYSGSRKSSNLTANTAGSGFHMGAESDGYLDVDVYTEPTDTTAVGDNKNWVWDKDLWKWIAVQSDSAYALGQNHDFVFVVKGGAERNPWYAPDSTIVKTPSEPLGTKTMKIDNPKLYISNPVVSNLPKDERAVFSLRLTNETEYKGDLANLRTIPMNLYVKNDSNPNGARIYIDGEAISDGMEIWLAPGESVVKTLEVERGAKGYDYENIGITLEDQSLSLSDTKYITVHYLPESTPLKITTPSDKWVMNTLSAKDESGKYYLPVNISGFDINTENFDHIEFQYKKQTEGDDSWVNLCSYYAKDDEYYQKATGTKSLLTSGSISDIRFYGEKDPMEMKYDLRAVSFCRLGSGYVTYASPVVSGTKDTRPPVIFGNPEPTDGILSYGDVMSMTFSEDIAYNYLDETANFQVTGYTNTSAAETKTYLVIDKNTVATSSVTQSLTAHDFSVEMMARVDQQNEPNDLIKVVSTDQSGKTLAFREYKNRLQICYDGIVLAYSRELSQSITTDLVHVGFVYNHDEKSAPVQFFAGDNLIETTIPDAMMTLWETGNVSLKLSGKVTFSNSSGKVGINSCRIWSKQLSGNEVANLSSRSITGGEVDLVNCWTMTDGNGTVAKDCAAGNNLTITNPRWHTMDGKALALNKRQLMFSGSEAAKFSRQSTEDYTVAFWTGAREFTEGADSVSLFHAGDPKLYTETGRFNIFLKKEDGKYLLKLDSEGKIVSLGTTDFSNLDWHHIAVSVNHSLNSVNAYVDGEMVAQTTGSNVAGLSTSEVALGDSCLTGVFDEVEFWQLALPSSYMNTFYHVQRLGNEMGMTVYLPFETMHRENKTYTMEFSAFNQATYNSPGSTEINVNSRDPLFALAPSLGINSIDNQAPINSNSGIESLPFTWTGTDTKLQINVQKDDYDINGHNINITVRGVEDLAGNPMANPVMWTMYVQRNVLFFGDKNISVSTPYGTKAKVNTTIHNDCGKVMSYTIESASSWLTPLTTYGQMNPTEEENVEFEISDGLSPGSYNTKVYLTDENGLTQAVSVFVDVTVEKPDWKVTTDKSYTNTMNLMADVYQQNAFTQWVIDVDEDDLIGAFIDNACVGLTNLTVDKTTGASHLYMTIRGDDNASSNNSEVVFRLWDASSGDIMYISRGSLADGVWTAEPIKFVSDAVIGGDSPVMMRTSSARQQTISLNEGWNWISFNIVPENNIFTNTDMFSVDDMFKCSNGTSIYQGDGKWTELKDFVPTKSNVYEVYVQNACSFNVDGHVIDDDNLEVTLNFGSRNWAELAYLEDVTLPLSQALTDFRIGDKAPVGTVVKTYNEFAVASSDGKWVGSLQYMRPGVGYYVNCNGERTTKTIKYTHQTSESKSRKVAVSGLDDDTQLSAFNIQRSVLNDGTMPVIATFKDGDVEEGDIVLAYANGDIVGCAELTPLDSDALTTNENAESGLFFLSVNAPENSSVNFVKVRNGEAVATTRRSIPYVSTGIVGTLEKPYQIDFDETSSEKIYDVAGRRYSKASSLHGIGIVGGKKILMGR